MVRFIFILILTFIFSPATVFSQPQNEKPVIKEVTPLKAYSGESITIKGEHFSKIKQQNLVFFDKLQAEVKSANEDFIEVIVPENAKVSNLYVEVSGQKSNEFKFYVLPYVELKLASSKIEIGKKTKGIIKVYGSKKPWTVQVINKYYEIIDIDGGREITLTTSGGEDNVAEIGIIAKKKGNFNINFKVLSGDPQAKREDSLDSEKIPKENTPAEEALKKAEDKKRSEEEALKKAEDKKRSEEEALKKAEDKKRSEEEALKKAEDKKRSEEEALKKAEDKKRSEEEALKKAEDKKRSEEEALKKAEDKKRSEEEALKKAEDKKRSEEEALKKAEDKKRSEEEALKKAEDKKRSEEEALKKAEDKKRSEEEALKKAEDKKRSEEEALKKNPPAKSVDDLNIPDTKETFFRPKNDF